MKNNKIINKAILIVLLIGIRMFFCSDSCSVTDTCGSYVRQPQAISFVLVPANNVMFNNTKTPNCIGAYNTYTNAINLLEILANSYSQVKFFTESVDQCNGIPRESSYCCVKPNSSCFNIITNRFILTGYYNFLMKTKFKVQIYLLQSNQNFAQNVNFNVYEGTTIIESNYANLPTEIPIIMNLKQVANVNYNLQSQNINTCYNF